MFGVWIGAGDLMQRVQGTLAAKILQPRHADGTLLRSRLIDALHEHVDRRLQFLIAPAGFGKTTLLVDFTHDATFETYWATLDAGDRDIVAFVETIVAAIGRVAPGFGERTLGLVRGSQDVESRAPALARALALEAEQSIDGLGVLVLDDYHEVDGSAAVTQFMNELLRLLPDSLRVVLASRTLPSLTISRLLVEQQVFGLGEADLRFTSDELLTLLRRRGQALTPVQAASLAEGAEGWIAGFLLSVPELWGGLVGGMIATGGGDGPLYDYLAAEAFDRQPPELQRFLLATSVPQTADAELGAALLGEVDWPLMVDRAERAGLFVTRLRAGRGAFRYHGLFRRFLQTRLRRTDAAEYARLHGLAAAVMSARGDWPAALVHLREAGHEAEAAAILAGAAPELERACRWRVLAAAVADLPLEHARAYPALLLAGERAALRTDDAARAEMLSEAVRVLGTELGDARLEGWGLAGRGHVLRLQGRTSAALEMLQRAAVVAEADDELVATVRRQAGKLLGVQGDFRGAATMLRQALEVFDRSGSDDEAAQCEFGLGVALARCGEIGAAIARYQSALARWQRLGDLAMQAEMLNCIGSAYGHRGDYPQARVELERALACARDGGYEITQAATLHSLGEVLLALGEPAKAQTALEQGLAVAQEIGASWVIAHLYDALALTAAFSGDLTRAEEYAHHAVALGQRQESPYIEALGSVTLGVVQTRLGRARALATLQQAAAKLLEMSKGREAVRAAVWQAQAEFAAGQTADARASLATAVQMAAELGSDGVFDLHARWDASLFQWSIAEGIEPARLTAVVERAGVALPMALPSAPSLSLPALDARAFGPGTLVIDGDREVTWAWEKTRELFFFLLHSGPRRREQVVTALWPDADPAKAKAGLHTSVYRLRKAVHQEAIVVRDGVYRINEELITGYDVRRFERLAEAGLSAEGDSAAALLQQAADLAAARFLDGVDAEWCAAERDRLERRHVAVLDRLIDACAAAGRARDSIAAAEQLLALDPLREDAYARMIRAHLRLGERSAALRHFERCVTALRDELAIEPGPELQALGRRIAL